MKKLLFTLSFVCILSCQQGFAQDSLSMASKNLSMRILDKLNDELSLTEKQRNEIYPLLIERSETIKETKAKNKPEKLNIAAVKKINEQTYKKLEKVLTKEQFKKLHTLREASRKQKARYAEEVVYKTEEDIELEF
jgi:hypothetical protein